MILFLKFTVQNFQSFPVAVGSDCFCSFRAMMGLRSTRTCSRASGVAPSWGGGGTLTACPLHPQGQAQRPLPPGWGGWTDGQMPILARIEEALKKNPDFPSSVISFMFTGWNSFKDCLPNLSCRKTVTSAF